MDRFDVLYFIIFFQICNFSLELPQEFVSAIIKHKSYWIFYFL